MQHISDDVFKQETDHRLKILERNLDRIDDDVQNLVLMTTELMNSIKDLQNHAIQVAGMQDRLTRYISSWPFVRVRDRDTE